MMLFNLVVVFDPARKHVLMCRRSKAPYKGLLNFVGGKIERGEDHQASAYRELQEETAIPPDQILLTHVMDLTYPMEDCVMKVYTGILRTPIKVCGEENELLWVPVSADFSDITQFAGYGNIYHIMSYILAN